MHIDAKKRRGNRPQVGFSLVARRFVERKKDVESAIRSGGEGNATKIT